VLEEVDIEVIQQQEISFRLIDDSASNEIRAELAIMDSTKTDRFKFDMGVSSMSGRFYFFPHDRDKKNPKQ
jgi:hypothetical protein